MQQHKHSPFSALPHQPHSSLDRGSKREMVDQIILDLLWFFSLTSPSQPNLWDANCLYLKHVAQSIISGNRVMQIFGVFFVNVDFVYV